MGSRFFGFYPTFHGVIRGFSTKGIQRARE